MDKTLALFLDPYQYISKICREKKSDFFQTTIFMKDAICLTGEAAAKEVFYDNEKIQRHGASPGMLQATLLGKDGVQGLDGAAHRHRKAMFMSIMTSENVIQLGRIVSEIWDERLEQWTLASEILLYEELQYILTEAVCRWAGVPLSDSELITKTKELTALFDAAGSKNVFRHLYSRFSRKKLESWAMDVVRHIRETSTQIITPAQIIALHRDLKGDLLDEHTAAVEILNLLRPVIAVSVYMTFTAHALILHPQSREPLKFHQLSYEKWFISEVRRFYPFFPTALGKVKNDFIWRGQKFKKDMLVLFDLYGTNHDPQVWIKPKRFSPERFKDTLVTPYNFVPQGGGTHENHHRCPGEFITEELMKIAIDFFVRKISYTIPEQNLAVDLMRTPPIPRDKFIMANIRKKLFTGIFENHENKNVSFQ